MLSIGLYLWVSSATFSLGYPLDDSWIHQTYARNLAAGEGWVFITGHISGGSTSPFWSALLSVAYLLKMPAFAWTIFLGWLLLWGLAACFMTAFRHLSPQKTIPPLWGGVMIALEWHLVWASVSGMETALFALLCLLAITWLLAGWEHWIVLGVLIGLSVWVRPDGVTLLGPAVWVLVWQSGGWKDQIRNVARLGSGFLLAFFPYLLFNRLVAGTWWPNTFYAKQAEYAVKLTAPLLDRLAEQAMLPLVGVGLLLLPGFMAQMWLDVRDRQWARLAGPLWGLGFLVVFALRLPVAYQHGRYAIPMMAVYYLFGLAGTARLLQPGSSRTWQRVLSKAWIASAALLLASFWILGARAYGRDVAFIQTEMVTTAQWLDQNTRADESFAAHDIGALGYFTNRQLLDLAGLVSPEVIPFIRDETALAAYLDANGADYLVAFPGWYPQLVRRGEAVFTTASPYAIQQGGENMVVYRWLTKP